MRRQSVLWLVPLALLACQRDAPPAAPDVVARIGEAEEVRYAEFEKYLERTVGDPESVLASDVLSQIFDQFLDEKILVRLAADRGLTASGEGTKRDRRAIDALLKDGLEEAPSQQEIARYYQEHRQEFARPERVRLRQILTEDRATAERALAQITAGADFAEVAQKLSRDPSASSGGYQGELSRADLPPAFADVIFGLKPGEVSRIVPADYGFHLFQVVARSPAEVVPLEGARGEIVGKLRQEQADRLLASLVTEGRNRYNVTIYERNLPFNYAGSYK
ncbi:MAG TPA: peptidylprolyl isomerase [Thermoanaerobaculia bacterium]|nr:peptidylprolyl isomerase [Thermoanaerobaculia bacterium]